MTVNTAVCHYQKLPEGPVLILDTETGGIKAERNPLLSVGMLYANDTEIIDWKVCTLRPPAGTCLELPVHEDQVRGKRGRRIEAWVEINTGQRFAADSEPPGPIISAEAAEINGFVQATNTTPGWDLSGITEWGEASYDEATEILNAWLREHPAHAVVAHAAAFDQRFVRTWLPRVALPESWYCTQAAFQYGLNGGERKGTSVAAICALAGYTPALALHTEIGDTLATYHIWKWLRSKGL